MAKSFVSGNQSGSRNYRNGTFRNAIIALAEDGFVTFPGEHQTRLWATRANAYADKLLSDLNAPFEHTDCGGTWFVGLDALPNAKDGSFEGTSLNGHAFDLVREFFGNVALHRAQLSVTWPGYPKHRNNESDAALRYRIKRDAAHVDGILKEGPNNRRFLREPHLFILGIALSDIHAGCSPLTLWKGSHRMVRDALSKCFAQAGSYDADITDTYSTVRKDVFANCTRLTLQMKQGDVVLLDARTLHGIEPWCNDMQTCRKMAYFRPIDPSGIAAWLAPHWA